MARTRNCQPYQFEFSELITGHHVYKNVWTPFIGEKLECEREHDNEQDKFAVKVVKEDAVVGHVPRMISRPLSYIIGNGGVVVVEVTGIRQNRRNNGLNTMSKDLSLQ